MRRGIALWLCVMLAAAGVAWGRVDVGGWLTAVGEVRTESFLTMGPYTIHRTLEVTGTIGNTNSGSYEDEDGAWAWMTNFDVSGHIRMMNEVASKLDSGSGTVDLRAGVWVDGDCTAHFWDFSAILGDATSGWVRTGHGATGVATPWLLYRTWLYGGGESAPADVHARTSHHAASDSLIFDNTIEFTVYNGETASIDGGSDIVVSNEAFSVWADPQIWINDW